MALWLRQPLNLDRIISGRFGEAPIMEDARLIARRQEVEMLTNLWHKGLRVSPIGYGCYAAGGAYGTVDKAVMKEVIVRAYDLGVTYFDVADSYGEAEQLLGEALAPCRDQVTIATKVGAPQGAEARLGRDDIHKACVQSLRALQTDIIDLYQIHFDDPLTPVAETIGALEELKKEGKICHYGLGHLPLERVREYVTAGDPFSVSMELSAVAPGARTSLLPLCRQHGVGAIAFSVTGRGLLAGRFDANTEFERSDIRRIDPLFQRERFRHGLRLTKELGQMAALEGVTPVQLAIAWVLRQPGVLCALTGPTSIPHLEENLAACEIKLSDDRFQAVDALISETHSALRQEQAEVVSCILNDPLPEDPEAAFVDLLYVVETALDLDLSTEVEILPAFHELFGLRQRLAGSGPALSRMQELLKAIIRTDPN